MDRIVNFTRLHMMNGEQNSDVETPLMCDDEEVLEVKSAPLAARRSKFEIPSSQIIPLLVSYASFFIPSFMHRFGKRHISSTTPNISETTYLNGVRGLASILVYFQHIATEYGMWIHTGYRSSANDIYFIQLPFVRLLFSGRFMVAIFFILSGYVLAYKPLQLSRKQDSSQLFSNLSSAVFRRAPRLFLPALAAMVLTAIFGQYYGCFGAGNPMDMNCVPAQPSLWAQILRMWGNFMAMLNPFTWAEFYPESVPQLWTLPMEFRGSMAVFLLVLCFGGSRPFIRMLFLLSIGFYCISNTHWDTFLFICGIVLAELRIFRKESLYIYAFDFSKGNAALKSGWPTIKSIFWISILILSLFIGSWPAYGASSAMGFKSFAYYTPTIYSNELLQQYFWISVGALLLLLAFEHFEPLQKPFTSALAVYAGDISFGLYIVHWPLMQTIGRKIIPSVTRIASSEAQPFSATWWLGAVLFTPIVVWAADCHWRAFDMQSVRFARWLSGVCAKPK